MDVIDLRPNKRGVWVYVNDRPRRNKWKWKLEFIVPVCLYIPIAPFLEQLVYGIPMPLAAIILFFFSMSVTIAFGAALLFAHKSAQRLRCVCEAPAERSKPVLPPAFLFEPKSIARV